MLRRKYETQDVESMKLSSQVLKICRRFVSLGINLNWLVCDSVYDSIIMVVFALHWNRVKGTQRTWVWRCKANFSVCFKLL